MADFEPFWVMIDQDTRKDISDLSDAYGFAVGIQSDWEHWTGYAGPVLRESGDFKVNFAADGTFFYFDALLSLLQAATDSLSFEWPTQTSINHYNGAIEEARRDVPTFISDLASIRPERLFGSDKPNRNQQARIQQLEDKSFFQTIGLAATPSMMQRIVTQTLTKLNVVGKVNGLDSELEKLEDQFEKFKDRIDGFTALENLNNQYEKAIRVWQTNEAEHKCSIKIAYCAAAGFALAGMIYVAVMLACFPPGTGSGLSFLQNLRQLLWQAFPLAAFITGATLSIRFAHTSRLAALDAQQRHSMFNTFRVVTVENGHQTEQWERSHILEALFRRADLSGGKSDIATGHDAVDALIRLAQKK